MEIWLRLWLGLEVHESKELYRIDPFMLMLVKPLALVYGS